jgi:hypothetical protein
MNALRFKVSNRLLAAGATQALDCRDMWGKCQRSGVSSVDNSDLQILAVLETLSRVAIRLGIIIMPSRLANI